MRQNAFEIGTRDKFATHLRKEFSQTIVYIHKLWHTPRILCLESLWEELVLRIQNCGLTTQRDTEKLREPFLIWPIFNQNFTFKWVKVSIFRPILCFFVIRDDPSRSELIRVDPTRTGGPSCSGPTFVPACPSSKKRVGGSTPMLKGERNGKFKKLFVK